MNERDRIAEFLGRLDYESSNDHPLSAPACPPKPCAKAGCLQLARRSARGCGAKVGERILRRSGFPLVFTLVLWLFIPGASASITKWDPLPTPVGNANFRGYAQIERELGSWALPDGTEIPLHLVLQSDPRIEPGPLGPGWHFPFFRSDFQRVKDYEAVWEMPNGRRKFFPRDRLSEDSRDDEQLFRSRDGEWMAVWEKDRDEIEATVTSTEDPEWWFHYEEGRLHSFQMGSESPEFQVDWLGGSNYPRMIRPSNRREGPVEIVYAGRTPEAIRVEDHIWKIETGSGDWTAPDGRSDYADYRVNFLTELVDPDGGVEKFVYEKGDSNERSVGVLDQPGVTKVVRLPVNRLSLQNVEGADRGFLAWEARSGFLVEDSGGAYAVTSRGQDPEQPDFAENQQKGDIAPDAVRIERQPEEGAKELWSYNYRTGVRERTDSSTGEVFRDTFIVSPGPAYAKLRKKEKKSAENGSWQLLERRAYDPTGRLIRESSPNALFHQVWSETRNGIIVERFRDGILVQRDRRNDGGLVEREIFRNDGSVTRYVYGHNGRRQTITEWRDGDPISYRELRSDGTLAFMKWSDGKEKYWGRTGSRDQILTIYSDGSKRLVERGPEDTRFNILDNAGTIAEVFERITQNKYKK
ncbi:MAG: hypothetical protein ACQKBT_00880 [Puniceicoccales bacterium]